MMHLNWMLILIFTGLTGLLVGINFREQSWGVALLALSGVTLLGSLGYRIHMALG